MSLVWSDTRGNNTDRKTNLLDSWETWLGVLLRDSSTSGLPMVFLSLPWLFCWLWQWNYQQMEIKAGGCWHIDSDVALLWLIVSLLSPCVMLFRSMQSSSDVKPDWYYEGSNCHSKWCKTNKNDLSAIAWHFAFQLKETSIANVFAKGGKKHPTAWFIWPWCLRAAKDVGWMASQWLFWKVPTLKAHLLASLDWINI